MKEYTIAFQVKRMDWISDGKKGDLVYFIVHAVVLRYELKQ